MTKKQCKRAIVYTLSGMLEIDLVDLDDDNLDLLSEQLNMWKEAPSDHE